MQAAAAASSSSNYFAAAAVVAAVAVPAKHELLPRIESTVVTNHRLQRTLEIGLKAIVPRRFH
jgi:hypothetical protein